MPIVVRGLVLKETNYGENNRIVTLLTAQLGKISAVCYGVRGGKRPKAAAQFLTYAEYELTQARNLYRIVQCETIRSYYSLTQDLSALAHATYFADLAAYLTQENDEAGETLQLLLGALDALSENKQDFSLIKAAFELRLLCIAGYTPELSACVGCGTSSQTLHFSGESVREEAPAGLLYFVPDEGCLLCADCRKGMPLTKALPLSRASLSAMRYIASRDSRNPFSFRISDRGKGELVPACEAYASLHTEGRLKSLRFLKEIGSMGLAESGEI